VKAPYRIGGWTLDADIERDLGSNPHRVDVAVDLTSDTGSTITVRADLTVADAARYGALLSALVNPADNLGHALDRAADADTCDRCGGPCDPGELLCPGCEGAA